MHNTNTPQIATATKQFISPTIMSTMTGAGIGLGMGSSMAVAGLTDTPLGLATAVTVPTTMILAIFGARLLTLRSCARNA